MMKPIFIGGCERSGTTLLGAMLGAHSACLCVPEMQFKLEIVQHANDEGRVEKATVMKPLVRRSNFRIWDLGLDVGAITPEQVSSQELIEWIVSAYGRKVGKLTPSLWVDHTPSNIRHAWTLLRLFPNAHVIHIVRDGRAVAASLLPLDWGPNEIDAAARYWAERLAFGFAAEWRWPERVTRVRYEDLVRDPRATLQDLCEELAIDYEPAMSEATGFVVPQYTAKQHALIGQAPDPARASGWEQQLTPRQVEIFESLTSDLLLILGYVPKFGVHAKRMSRLEQLTLGLRELYKREMVNRRRKRQRKRETIPG